MLVFTAVALATLAPVWRADGWPMNHEASAFALRTHIYARHFSWLDVLPIWSSVDVLGFGSPMPALYHKLFYVVAGWIALLTGSLKAAVAAAVGVLLVGGATGLYRTMRVLGTDRRASLIAGCCLIAANYTVTGWLVRGAMAEFSGAMMVPWVMFHFLRSMQSGRLTIGFGLALALLLLGHSVLAFYAVLILGTTYVALALFRLAPWSLCNPRTAWPTIACVLVVVAPYLVTVAILGPVYDMHRILAPPYHPVHQFRPPLAYLWETTWRFGESWSGLSTQMDPAMLVLAATGLGALLRRPGAGDAARWPVVRPALPLVGMVVLAAVLQLPVTAPFYEWVPGAAFIQFPWRLLALITPALIATAVYLVDQVLAHEPRSFVLGAATAWMLVSCGAFVPLRYERVQLAPQLRRVTFSGFREYEPRQAPPVAELQTQVSARWAEAGCSYDRPDDNADEVPAVLFRTSCPRSTVLPLPLYSSPLHEVRTSAAGRTQPCFALPELPDLCGAVIPSADATVSVTLPDMGAIARWAQRRARWIR